MPVAGKQPPTFHSRCDAKRLGLPSLPPTSSTKKSFILYSASTRDTASAWKQTDSAWHPGKSLELLSSSWLRKQRIREECVWKFHLTMLA